MQKRTFLSRFAAVAAVAGAGLASRLSAAAPAAESGSSASAQGAKQRAAVVYFTKTGNTESVARAVRAMTGADIYGVRTVKPYPEEYGATTDIVKDELDRNVIRELVPLEIDLTRYDVVVFATPTWWHHAAAPLLTKIREFPKGALNGKLVLTANTHGGGGLMHTREDFEKLLADSGAKLGTHLTVFGDVDEDDLKVRNWLRENNVL